MGTIILMMLMLCTVYCSSRSLIVSGQQSPPSSCPPLLTADNIVGARDIGPGADGVRLRVVMPWKTGFNEFVKFDPSTCMLDGFSVQVFRFVLDRMGEHAPSIQIILHGNGTQILSYDEMVEMVLRKDVDAIVADLTLTKTRMEKVGYTLPYLSTSIEMITPFRYASEPSSWYFLKPFSAQLWGVLVAGLAVTGLLLFGLENSSNLWWRFWRLRQATDPPTQNTNEAAHNYTSDTIHDHHTQAPSPPMQQPAQYYSSNQPKNTHDAAIIIPPTANSLLRHEIYQRFMNAYWFTSLCVFCAQQESIRTQLGRAVTLAWLLVMFIMFNASYTASLAALLSGQERTPVVQGFQALLKNGNLLVGYQEGSFMGSFLQNLAISSSRLKSFHSAVDFRNALRLGSAHGGVDVVIDELPFLVSLLKHNCDVTKISDNQLPTFGGFAFAFQKGSSLIHNVSKEILFLIENGTIKDLQHNWTIGSDQEDDTMDCSSKQVKFQNFAALFGILGAVYVLCIIWRVYQVIKKDGFNVICW